MRKKYSLESSDDISVIFVVHGGELETKAALLAASLRARMGGRIRIVAALATPADIWGEISKSTYRLYERLDVELREIVNPFGKAYPIGNKFSALALGGDQGGTIFLDSDILCLGMPDLDWLLRFDAALKPADVALIPTDVDYWEPLYRLAGLQPPVKRVLTSCTSELMLPYFNAGFIWMRQAASFAAQWLAIAKLIASASEIEHKWPWLDQLALPVALQSQGRQVKVLTERFNFPAHLKPLRCGADQLFCHYHELAVLPREVVLMELIDELRQRWPELDEVLHSCAAGRAILEADSGSEGQSAEDILITGLPRSGTSYLCRLLSERPDTVIVNEPPQVFSALGESVLPWGIPRMYEELRREIRNGRPILNKHNGGRILEDTALGGDIATPYLAEAQSPRFMLGTKNTLAYLSRLPAIQRTMPWVRCIGLIRHPYDSLTSWSRTFEHLRVASVEAQAIAHPDDPALAGWQRKALLEIVSTESPALRRALWWRYLAWQLLDARDLRWMRYEDLISSPREMANRLVEGRPLPEFSPITSAAELTDEERDLISSVVCEVAERFQYVL
ncbi:sulfotransferase [Pseudomonas nitroreducens]|uniref:sulfotransferase n=1 Tax=Pseudomonas nitroreducens TaxID=46680 RepID=UPI00265A283A|nr:sulfotransferase [Pseudomonas nitroreducens]MCP1647404.1 hypothetical protein [Pseudomonas nitroreducens]MCP1685980.1 hypothetical protein [Pseudomonas nitroreducens]